MDHSFFFLGELENEEEKEQQKGVEKEYNSLIDKVTELLGEEVSEVRVTYRLTDSPACLVVSEDDRGMQMRRILESAGQALPETKRIFEINPDHPLVKKLNDEVDVDRFNDLVMVLFDQAKLAEGTQLLEPATYVARLNRLLLDLAG